MLDENGVKHLQDKNFLQNYLLCDINTFQNNCQDIMEDENEQSGDENDIDGDEFLELDTARLGAKEEKQVSNEL